MDANYCAQCFVDRILSDDQKDEYYNGSLHLEVWGDGDDVCSCCGELAPIVRSYSTDDEDSAYYDDEEQTDDDENNDEYDYDDDEDDDDEDDEDKDYCEECYADEFLDEDEYEQWLDGDLELYTGDYMGICACCGEYTAMVSSKRGPDWGE